MDSTNTRKRKIAESPEKSAKLQKTTMDLLEGIQNIPGQTAGEKFKYINITAKNAAEKNIQPANFPNPLEPLLNVEVAKISHNVDVIIKMLMTSDSLLCHRALQIPNLFTSETSPLLNWDYFYNQLLSRVSLTTRCKVIKKLETDLQSQNPKIAEEFYLNISKIWGEKQAHSLLLACSEDFIFNRIQKENLILSIRNVTKLFHKNSALVAKYLAFLNDSEKLKSKSLIRFLPNLIDDHFDLLISILNKNPIWQISLGKRRTKIFLKKGKQLLLENPAMYFRCLSLQIVSSKLNTDEFSTMVSKQCHKEMSRFSFRSIMTVVKFFSAEKRSDIALAAFKKAYGEDLSNHPALIDRHLLAILPPEMRIEMAMKKLEQDSDWNLNNLENSWRSYLPFSKICADVKTQMVKRSDANDRKCFINLLIFCCKINKDQDGLLELLKYIKVRHKNEKSNIWTSILEYMSVKIRLAELKQEHWDILIEILQQQEVMNGFSAYHSSYLREGIRFKLLNKLDPDEYLQYLLRAMILNEQGNFDFFVENKKLVLQKVCLDKSMDFIAKAYSLYNKKDKDQWDYNVLDKLFNAMEWYNRQVKTKVKDLPLVKLEDHPSLIEFIDSIPVECLDEYLNIQYYVGLYNPNLSEKWYPDSNSLEDHRSISKKDIKILKKDFCKVLSKWNVYQNRIFDFGTNTVTKTFIKTIRWYQDLPIQLRTLCMSFVNDPENYKSLEILGWLLESSKFQELIDELVPELLTVDPEDEMSVNQKDQAEFYFKGMKLTNQPLPLSFFKKFFTGDYLPLCRSTLEQTACRTPVPAVIDFVSTSLNDRVAVVKTLNNLVAVTAPMKDRLEIYKTVFHSNTHSSIHGSILLKVLQLFRKDPSQEGWNFLSECIDKKLIEDVSVLGKLGILNNIPDEHLEVYVKKMLLIFNKVQIEGCPQLSDQLISQILSQLYGEKYSQVLSDEFQIELIQDYTFEAEFKSRPFLSPHFIFNVFLKGMNQQRTGVFLDTFNRYVEMYFGKPLEKNKKVSYPANRIVRDVIIHFVSVVSKDPSKVAVLDRLMAIFEGLISPYQDMKSYLFLIWIKMYVVSLDIKNFGTQFGQNLDTWLQSFGCAFLPQMVKLVREFLVNNFVQDYKVKECLWEFVNGIFDIKTEYCYLTIALLLHEFEDSIEKKNIVEELKKSAFPSVLICVNDNVYGIY